MPSFPTHLGGPAPSPICVLVLLAALVLLAELAALVLLGAELAAGVAVHGTEVHAVEARPVEAPHPRRFLPRARRTSTALDTEFWPTPDAGGVKRP